MFLNGMELIVQYPDYGGYRCRGFRQLHLAEPAFVVFDGAQQADQPTAAQLGRAFCEEVLHQAGAVEEADIPCGGHVFGMGCHALHEPASRKVLVRPAASNFSSTASDLVPPSAEPIWLAAGTDPQWNVIPVLPAGASVAAHVPPAWRGINVCFWDRQPIEALGPVAQRCGLAPAANRLFISYVRADSTPVADQLFEALTWEGFDVFLDRCSVPVGVQFQERLMQDLCDKAMVVLLNSPGVAHSHWVEEEIAIVKAYRLGLFELRFPGAQERPDIDADFRRDIGSADLQPAGGHYAPSAQELTPATLTDIVDRIKTIHARALHRQRYELIDNFAAALAAAGRTAQVLPDGSFLLPADATGRERVVGLTARPPELEEFCLLHERGQISPQRTGWLVSPAPFFLARRQSQVSWLGRVCNIQHANEAQMIRLAASL